MSKGYFSYDPNNGFQLYETAEAAQQDAEAILAEYRKASSFDGEWASEADDVCWGALKQKSVATGDDEEGFTVDLVDVATTEAAAMAATVPTGWKLVPVKPTPQMSKAAADAWLDCGSKLVLNKASAAVAAGIAAAPQAPVAGQPAEPSPSDPIRGLLQAHEDLIEQGENYAYFELAYTRRTGWMAWLTDRPASGEPGTAEYAKSRKVIARGQGDSAEEACQDALDVIAAPKGDSNG